MTLIIGQMWHHNDNRMAFVKSHLPHNTILVMSFILIMVTSNWHWDACDITNATLVVSVTRLGIFRKFFATNFLPKVAQIFLTTFRLFRKITLCEWTLLWLLLWQLLKKYFISKSGHTASGITLHNLQSKDEWRWKELSKFPKKSDWRIDRHSLTPGPRRIHIFVTLVSLTLIYTLSTLGIR